MTPARRQGLRIALMLAPALVVTGGLFLTGLGVAVLRSFGLAPGAGDLTPDLSAWAALVQGRQGTGGSVLLTFHIALVATAVSTVMGVAAALALRQTRAGRGLAGFLFRVNLTVPHVVAAVGILYLFGQSGLMARLAHAGGLIDRPAEFPALVHDPAAIGILLVYIWKEVPFIGVVVLAQLQAVGRDWEGAARSLGAGPWQCFRHVTWPMIAPGTLAAAVVVFAFAFGSYEVPLLLGQSHPQALPVLAWRLYTDVDLDGRAQAMALAVVMTAVSAGLIAIWVRAMRGRG